MAQTSLRVQMDEEDEEEGLEATLAAIDDVNNHRNLSGPFHSIEELKEALNA